LSCGLGGQGVELFSWREAFYPFLSRQLAFLQHMHELNSTDLQESLLAEAKRCLATAGSTPGPVIEPTRDEANHATPVFWPEPLVVPRPPGAA
jgi:hypothetical protein